MGRFLFGFPFRSVLALSLALVAGAQSLPVVADVDPQPLAAQVARVVQALELAGSPLEPERRRALEAALAEADPRRSVADVQAALDPLCLVGVGVNPESRVSVRPGPAPRSLVQHGWRVFLVKVHNEAGVTARLSPREA